MPPSFLDGPRARWIPIGAFVAGLASGVAFGPLASSDAFSAVSPRARAIQETNAETKYAFIEPLLGCDTSSGASGDLGSLHEKLVRRIQADKRERRARRVSAYYRDLKSGRWTSLDPHEKYAPASLQKLPLMMSYMRLARSEPELMQRSLVNEQPWDQNEIVYYKPSARIERGASYEVASLIRAGLVHSDNNATRLLMDNLGKEPLATLYSDLGLTRPDFDDLGGQEQVSTYASFFRVLYSATYLRRRFSEETLRMLAEAEFSDGLRAGVPPDVRVAHKFGERAYPNGARELHDCGIVYYPLHPYVLCLMTEGRDFDELASVVRGVSELTYLWVDDNRLGALRD